MLDEFGKLYLCDFGESYFFEKFCDEVKGTPGSVRFMAPELLGIQKNSVMSGKRIDMWAAGVTLFNLLTKQFPFNGKSYPQI